jgi:hypothetical protein
VAGIVALIASAAVVPMAACHDECQSGSDKCEGNTVWTCGGEENGPRHWVRFQDCGPHTCRQAATRAVCSLRPDPDPICVGDAANAATCDGSLIVHCQVGYRVAEGDDCHSPALCGGSECSTVGGRHPVCEALVEPTASVRTTCFRNHVLVCREGQLRALTDCAQQQCALTAPPPPGAEFCQNGKCIPYYPEPLATCR